jgi:uncharacterized protein (TIGR02246 family)
MFDLGGVLDEFSAAFDAQDTERLRALFVDDDASLVTSESLILTSREHIYVFIDAYAAQPTHFSFGWGVREVHDHGDVGWVIAFGHETAHRPTGDEINAFRLTLICRRTEEGWRISHLHASSPA